MSEAVFRRAAFPEKQFLEFDIATSDEERLRSRAQKAVYVFSQARLIRADAPLMAAIRAYIREQRDELAVLLDDLGD